MKNQLVCNLIPNLNGDIRILQLTGFLTEDKKLTQKSETSLVNIEGIFKKLKPNTPEDILGNNYMNEIAEYRKKFPVGKKATADEIINKFCKLFTKYPTLQWKIIHQAVDLYMSEQRDETYTMKAGNFIMVQRAGDTSYTLSEYYERVTDGEKAHTIPDIIAE